MRETSKKYGQLIRKFAFLALTFFLVVFYLNSHALPFSVVPNGALPTAVPLGGTVAASYIVTNNTASQRNANFVKYLPPNVTVAGGGCGSTFNLSAKGQAGDSCVLNLTVSGEVNANDANPSHHLFICFPGGQTCAGTSYPIHIPKTLLSVTITPTSSTIKQGKTQQYTAIGHYSNNTTADITSSVTWISSDSLTATITNAGLATGVNTGTSNITAASGPVISNSSPLTVEAFVYVANLGNNTLTYCQVNAVGGFNNCATTGSGFIQPASIALNANNSFAYVANANFNNGFLSLCVVNADGTLSGCSTQASGFGTSLGIALNPSGTIIYVSDLGSNTVFYCPVNQVNGTLGACQNTGGVGFNQPLAIAFNAAGTKAYVSNVAISGVGVAGAAISFCDVNTIGTLSNCTLIGNDLAGPQGIVFNNDRSLIWIENHDNDTVYYCPVNSNGTFGSCQNTTAVGFVNPAGIAINFANTFLYISNYNNQNVVQCPINANGTLGACVLAVNGLSNPFGIAINH